MALILKNRVLETCTSPGISAVSLLGATTGYSTFGSSIGDGNTTYYTIADQSGSNWEVGIGTYTAATNSLSRTIVLSNSLGTTALINFGSGTQNVFVSQPAETIPIASLSNAANALPITALNPQQTQDQVLYEAQTADAPVFVSIAGDPSGDFAGVNILEQVVTDGTGLAINTRTLNPPKLDVNNAAVPSDAPPSATLYLGVNSPQTIDTTGYQTVVFQQTGAVAITVNHSNDGVNFQPVFGIPLTAATNTYVGATAATAQLVYAFPVAAKFMRFSAATQTSAIVYLRQTPFASYAGLGTSTVTVGSGAVTVSGTVAVGTAASANPVPLGGADYNSATRRIQTDTNGNTQVVGQLPVGYQTGIYNATYGGYSQTINPITATLSSVNPVMVGGTDNTGAARRIQTDMFGIPLVRGAPSTPATQSLEDLLTQILGTLRVLTHYTYEGQLRDGFRSAADEPDILLADYLNPASTLFNMTN